MNPEQIPVQEKRNGRPLDGAAGFDFRPLVRAIRPQPQARIAIRAKRKILLIDTADVIAIEAQGNYVLVQQASTSHLLRESISNMEDKLYRHGFVRIHRSVLVNAAWVEEIEPCSTGEYVLRAKHKEYIVTRTYRKNVRQLAQLWIGNSGLAGD